MFIQTQHSSSGINTTTTSSTSSSQNNVGGNHHHKKRKLDYNVSQPVIQHPLLHSTTTTASNNDYHVDNNQSLQQRYTVSGASNSTAFTALQHNNNALLLHKTSPNQQTLMRASTIKLLDTYQRCGQKVHTRAILKKKKLMFVSGDCFHNFPFHILFFFLFLSMMN